MAATTAKDKYYLRSLHEEIDLYDRKLAHLLKYDNFASDKERDAAAEKLNSKRELLARDARHLVESGIEFKVSEVPRSMRTPEQLADLSSRKQPEKAAAPTEIPSEGRVEEPSPGSFSQLRKEIDEYMKKRQKTQNQPRNPKKI